MIDMNTKFSFCPRCGKKLIAITNSTDNKIMYMCPQGGCGTVIKDNAVTTDNITLYAMYGTVLNKAKEPENTFMLLKENLSGPMLQKLTNTALEKDKSMYCIVHASSKEDAIAKFKRKFSIIKITEEMVIPINIMEA